MSWPETILFAALWAICLAGPAYAWMAVKIRRSRWQEKPGREVSEAELPSLVLLRPIKANVPALREKMCVLAGAMRPGDRLVLGVDNYEDAETAEEVRAMQARGGLFADREIVIVRCDQRPALNPKISKLMQMGSAVPGEHLVVSDSEAHIDATLLDAFRREWVASGADVLTCGYDFYRPIYGKASWLQLLDAAQTYFSLWPGLLLMTRIGTLNFTLGACTGFRRSHLDAVGGWAAFGNDLAEDNRLGAALARAGRKICLSRCVVPLDSDSLNRWQYWRHQRRVAVTYRICNPAGFAGMFFTHSVWANIALVALFPATPWESVTVLIACLYLQFFRWNFYQEDFAYVSGFSKLRFPAAMLISDLVETVCWVLAWISPTVWWAGRWWRISRDGKLRSPP